MAIIRNLDGWHKRSSNYPPTTDNASVLMASPDCFAVVEVHNSHMADSDGKPQRIDSKEATKQWEQLHDSFASKGLNVEVLDAQSSLVDLVFTANPSFIVPLHKHAWQSKMAHNSRRPEVELHSAFFESRGYEIKHLSANAIKCEGHGDGLWHPRRFLLHAAVGQRSDLQAWCEIDEAYPELDILLYELEHPDFYHLDTALACLDEQTALIIESAFTAEGLALVKAAFPEAISLSNNEAYKFAGNAFCADSKHVFIEQGCDDLNSELSTRGFTVCPVATQQFRLSGGSVFCLKQSF